jgi:hypothetical protein
LACKDSSASAREKMKLIHYFLTCSIASRAARMGLGGQDGGQSHLLGHCLQSRQRRGIQPNINHRRQN